MNHRRRYVERGGTFVSGAVHVLYGIPGQGIHQHPSSIGFGHVFYLKHSKKLLIGPYCVLNKHPCCLAHVAHLCEKRAATLRHPCDSTFDRCHRFTTIPCIQQFVWICTPATIQPVISGIQTLGDQRYAPVCNSRMYQ